AGETKRRRHGIPFHGVRGRSRADSGKGLENTETGRVRFVGGRPRTLDFGGYVTRRGRFGTTATEEPRGPDPGGLLRRRGNLRPAQSPSGSGQPQRITLSLLVFCAFNSLFKGKIMAQADIGLIGLAVMGENLVLNMESRGYTVAVFNRTVAKVDELVNGRGKGRKLVGAHTLKELVSSLKRPRKIMMMVKAGPAVDDLIDQLLPLLDKEDILIDGGNSYFPD